MHRVGRAADLDGAVNASRPGRVDLLGTVLWSHRCGWDELAEHSTSFSEASGMLDLYPEWTRRWSVTWRYAGGEVTAPVRDLGSTPVTGCEPVRRFSWSRRQRHRPGLQYLVSTDRLHGYESLEEARLLLVLDFAADLVEVISQPFRLRFSTEDGEREHVPDFLADTRAGRWLIDVRPAARVGERDRVAFAASAEVALLHGWRYVVVSGWKPHVLSTVDTLSAQRRPLTDRLGLVKTLLSSAAEKPHSFGELAELTVAPPIARAYLLHLLWHRRLGMDLTKPLGDASLVVCAEGGQR